MTKDVIGNDIKEGDLILFNNMLMTVTKIRGGEILGGGSILDSPQGKKITGMQLPGELICTCAIQYDPSKLVACYVLKNPSNQEVAKKVLEAQA